MKINKANYFVFILFVAFGITSKVTAATIRIDVTATVQDASGSYLDNTYASNLSVGQSVNGTFIFDTSEASANTAETTPSYEPGHEFTSFYDFAGAPYEVSVSSNNFNFTNTAPVGVVVNNNLLLTSAETNGAISTDGYYDWIEILGSTTSDVAGPHTPGNGQEWTLALIAEDGNWFTDGSVIPDNVPPSSYTPILIGLDFDSVGDEVGFVFASVDTLTVSAVPVPAAVWLFGSGLLTLVGLARRRASF